MELLAHPLVAILWSLVMVLAGGFLGDLRRSWSVTRVAADLAAHAALDAHPVSRKWHGQHDEDRDAMERRLDVRLQRIEAKLDRLAEIS